MSWSLKNEHGLMDQFATTSGLADLRRASTGQPALSEFFRDGQTENVPQCITELAVVASKTKDADIKSTALGLAKMMKGQKWLGITNGADD